MAMNDIKTKEKDKTNLEVSAFETFDIEDEILNQL
jgi:hypothetical protein